ncbi:MAG: Hsp20/alpha crystallin family protein [Chitinophaga rupis]
MTNIIKKGNAQPATFGSVVDQLFQNNLNRWFDDDLWGFNGVSTLKQPPLNIRETGESFELELVAPGLKKEDIHLQVSGNILSISYDHKEDNSQKDSAGQWVRREFKKQSFSRSFNLDETVNVENASARYENGVLHLSLPKKEQAKQVSRNIAIQ